MQPSGPILIVDDEDDLRNLLDVNLRREGFDTRLAATGTEAIDKLREERPSLIVLDLMLPDLPGTEVCRRVRADPSLRGTPIIMLTARGEEIDRVVGFEVGADDYVVKSTFSIREFLLRVRAVLRRAASARSEEPSHDAERTLDFGSLHIDLAGFRVFVADTEIALTATEFKLLQTLAERPGRVQSRGTLLQDVWDMAPDTNTRTVDTHVKRLREKLGEASSFLETVRGVGYRFSPTRR
ncbi:MAG: response regulator transcription factor [Myxococcales bacterium]|nr:response regulator transcription factor [Myxococcales bacterium]